MQRRTIGKMLSLTLILAVTSAVLGHPSLARAQTSRVAQKEPPQICGTLNVRIGETFSTGPANAEACFAQAFQSCGSAILTIQINPTGGGGRHTLRTGSSDEGCLIVDQTMPTFDSAPAGDTTNVTCSDLDLDSAGLKELLCTGGPPLAPIPAPTAAGS